MGGISLYQPLQPVHAIKRPMTANDNDHRGLLPAGLGDLLPPDAAREADAIDIAIKRFAAFGYDRVKLLNGPAVPWLTPVLEKPVTVKLGVVIVVVWLVSWVHPPSIPK